MLNILRSLSTDLRVVTLSHCVAVTSRCVGHARVYVRGPSEVNGSLWNLFQY